MHAVMARCGGVARARRLARPPAVAVAAFPSRPGPGAPGCPRAHGRTGLPLLGSYSLYKLPCAEHDIEISNREKRRGSREM